MTIQELKELVKPIQGITIETIKRTYGTAYSFTARIHIGTKRINIDSMTIKDLDNDKLILSTIKRMTESVARCQSNKLFLWLNNNDAIICPEFPDYYVSKGGKVYSTLDKRELKGHANKMGYVRYQLRVDGKKVRPFAHQLIAITYLGYIRPSTLPNWSGVKSDTIIIDHINEDASDNHLDNLQLITSRENLQKGQAYRYKNKQAA